jgi:hypothetical protein
MPEKITIWSEQSPTWEAAGGTSELLSTQDMPDPRYSKPIRVVARYPASGVLASGWLLGEKYLVGNSALLDVPVGSGHMILFGMRPQYRGQSYQNFKLLFNALVAY